MKLFHGITKYTRLSLSDQLQLTMNTSSFSCWMRELKIIKIPSFPISFLLKPSTSPFTCHKWDEHIDKKWLKIRKQSLHDTSLVLKPIAKYWKLAKCIMTQTFILYYWNKLIEIKMMMKNGFYIIYRDFYVMLFTRNVIK